MLPKQMASIKECDVCHKKLKPADFPLSKSQFFTDGRAPICKNCLSTEARAQKGSWEFVNSVCRWLDIAFKVEEWTKLYSQNEYTALARYLDIYAAAPTSFLSWEKQEQKYNLLTNENRELEIHPAFKKEKIDRQIKDWGNAYTDEDRDNLDEIYNGLKVAFGINDIVSEDYARKMSKVSLEIDRAIATGSPIDKLVSSYANLQKMGGFTSDNARDLNNFESCSELFLYLEKNNWVKKFHNDEDKDVVDTTIRAIQAHNTRLYRSESSIGEQINDRIAAKKRMDEMEERNSSINDDEAEQWNDAGYKVGEFIESLDDEPVEKFEIEE